MTAPFEGGLTEGASLGSFVGGHPTVWPAAGFPASGLTRSFHLERGFYWTRLSRGDDACEPGVPDIYRGPKPLANSASSTVVSYCRAGVIKYSPSG